MKRIEQVNELSALLQDTHGLKITPCELLELEDYNYNLANQAAGQLATEDLSEIRYDLGKAIGFVVGAVLGAFLLPGLGFGITGWLAGAVVGGSIGYRLVSLFDGGQGQRTDITDTSTRFTGVGQLGQLGEEIPVIYGNKDVNPDGGVIVKEPTTIYSRISTGLGVQYIERLSLLSTGVLGRVNTAATLFNDQIIPELNNSIEVSSGRAEQKALGQINHYSQSVALSINNSVGLRRILTIKDLGGARGGTANAANLINCTGSGTGTIANDTIGSPAWDSGFNTPALTCPASIGSYIFSSSTIGGATPIVMAIGFSYAGNANTTTPESMDTAYVLTGGDWQLQELGVVQSSGSSSLIASGAIIETRIYWTAGGSWVQLLVNDTEIDRTFIAYPLVNAAILPDFCFYSSGASLANRTTGVVAALTTAGNVTPGLGTRFTCESGSLSKLAIGKTYNGNGTNFTITAIETVANYFDVSPALWISDIVAKSDIGAFLNASSFLSEGYLATYTTSQKVTSLELLFNWSIFGKDDNNNPAFYSQAFEIFIRKNGTIPWVRVGAYVLQNDKEQVKTCTFALTSLPDDVYDIKVTPLDASDVTTVVDDLVPGFPAILLGSIPINGGTAQTIIERKEFLTAAQAKARLDLQPKLQSTERGASIQISHCNEIFNPFARLQASDPIAPIGNGTGLQGYYYNLQSGSLDIGTELGNRLDSVVNYSTNQPYSGLPPVTFPGWSSSRHFIIWTGSLIPRWTASYDFDIEYDDDTRLYIDNQLVIDRPNAGLKAAGSIYLAGGREYAIRVEYRNRQGGGYMTLRWKSAFFPREIVPTSQLKPAAPVNSTTELVCPTYPGYTIARTKLTSSDRLSSAPSESYDVELGSVIRMYLAYGMASVASSNGVVTDNSVPFNVKDLLAGDMLQVPSKGSMVITAAPTRGTLTCEQFTGQVFGATNESLLVFDFALWEKARPGMVLQAAGIPVGTIVSEVLPNNRIRITDRWGRNAKATIPTGSVTMNPSVPVVAGDELVVYRMGSSNYFPDCYVDRLINPISGLGNYIDENQFIDYRSIVAARRWCVANKFYFDGRIGGGSFEAWAIQTAPSSLLFATEIRGKYGLLIQDDEKPSYLFNDTNCDYEEPGVPFDTQLVNTVLVGYQDRAGKARQIKIQTTAANNGSEPEVTKTINVPGATSRAQVIKVGQVALKSLKIQTSVCTITTDVAAGLYCQQGDIVRTQHRAIEYSDESSGFVMAVQPPTNSRTTSRAIAIDRIEGGQLVATGRLALTEDIANPSRTTDSLSISGSSANNGALAANSTYVVDDYRLSIATLTPSTGGTLTATRSIADQMITLSEPITVTVNSRFICTHRNTRTTESDLLIEAVSGNTFKIIGLSEPLAVGDAWAVGSQSTFYKVWRLSSVQPDINANKVTFTGVAWSADVLLPDGLVTVG